MHLQSSRRDVLGYAAAASFLAPLRALAQDALPYRPAPLAGGTLDPRGDDKGTIVPAPPKSYWPYRGLSGPGRTASAASASGGWVSGLPDVRYQGPDNSTRWVTLANELFSPSEAEVTKAKRILDAMVDLPFALPTAVAGIALTAIYAPNGWLGQYLEPLGIKVAYTPLGILVALIFIGIPFVVRTVQPVIEDLDAEVQEAAATLGASRLDTLVRIVLPTLVPALLTGFALALARAVGEYGSVIFIAGNIPYVSEIAPLLIVGKLTEYNYAGATAIATLMLLISFVLLLIINLLQAWSRRGLDRG